MQLQGTLTGSAALASGSGEAVSAPAEQGEVQGADSASAEAVTGAPHAVPQPRQDSQDKPAAKKAAPKGKSPAKKTTAKKVAAQKTTAKKTIEKKMPAQAATAKEAPAKKAAGRKADGPTLHELILSILLASHSHPQTAREVFDALKAEHPERATSVQTVRNTLEILVKKNLAERSQQQGAAMYTALAGSDAPATGGEAEKVPEQV
ncbi:BlaI/MecI/CopY family transcriptional regulator [Streptomyces sp. NPDC088760]|uniref:BlaI/MecI/CopY family transcriptional regulator n=1 Tax=Streptomyces sp. NPDC088760 TaxID=3365890 RepID=UPI003815D6CB